MGLLDDLKKQLERARGDDARPAARDDRDTPRAPTPSTSPEPPATVPETTVEAVHAAMQAGEDVVLLDIRMPWDHAAQHPAGAQSLPLNELEMRLDELDPGQHYVLSCYHGITSQQAVAFLLAQGFERVESMQGGFSGWAAAGLPIEGRYA